MKFFERIVKEILKPLSDSRIDYCIIEGLAIIASGVRRGTADFDLAISGKQTEDALEILYKQGFKLVTDVGAEKKKLFYCGTLKQAMAYLKVSSPSAIKVNKGGWEGLFGDIWLRTPIPFEKLRNDALESKLYGEKVKLASVNNLIKLKKAAGRPVDKIDILELKSLRKSKKRTARKTKR